MKAFGSRLTAAREALGLTQKQLAARLKTVQGKGSKDSAHGQISRYEAGKAAPRIDTLCELAEALNKDPSELAFGVKSDFAISGRAGALATALRDAAEAAGEIEASLRPQEIDDAEPETIKPDFQKSREASEAKRKAAKKRGEPPPMPLYIPGKGLIPGTKHESRANWITVEERDMATRPDYSDKLPKYKPEDLAALGKPVRFAAGAARQVDPEELVEALLHVPTAEKDKKKQFAVKAEGNSMADTIKHGEIVVAELLDKGGFHLWPVDAETDQRTPLRFIQKHLHHRGVYLVSIDDGEGFTEWTMKRIHIHPGKRGQFAWKLMLMADNTYSGFGYSGILPIDRDMSVLFGAKIIQLPPR